jgi:hypothetical protein
VYRAIRLVIALLWGGTALGATVAGWRRFSRPGLLVAVLLAGCTSWQRSVPVPPEFTEAGVQAGVTVQFVLIPTISMCNDFNRL